MILVRYSLHSSCYSGSSHLSFSSNWALSSAQSKWILKYNVRELNKIAEGRGVNGRWRGVEVPDADDLRALLARTSRIVKEVLDAYERGEDTGSHLDAV